MKTLSIPLGLFLFLVLSFTQAKEVNYEESSIRGWTIHLNPLLKERDSEKTELALGILDEQLERVEKVVPAKALAELRKVPIWINPPYEGFGPKAEYHPDKEWLEENGRDPRMAKCIEITNFSIFGFENRRMPYLMLHELAHAYHDQVLGFEQEDIIQAYEAAKASGSYDEVKRFNGESTITDKAYAMTNHKEYFAENTEAYFGKNDFYPFNLEELKEHDPKVIDVLGKAWNLEAN